MKYTGPKSLSRTLQVILTMAWIFTIVSGALGVILTAWMALSGGMPGSSSIKVETSSLSILFHVPLDAAASRTWLLLMLGTVALPMMATVLYVLSRLRLIMATLVAGAPFAPENASRIRGIGVAILVAAVAQWAGGIATGNFLSEQVQLDGVEVVTRLNPDLTIVLFGLLVIVLAEVFRMGTQLQQEQNLTI